MSAIPMGRAMPAEMPRKRAGALWAHEGIDARGRLPLPLAVAAAAVLTLALGIAFFNLKLGPEDVDVPPMVTEVSIVDAPPDKPDEPPSPPPPPMPEPAPRQPAPTPVVPRKIPIQPPQPTPAPSEQLAAATAPPANQQPLDTNLPPVAAGPVAAPPQVTHPPTIGVVCPHQVKPELPRAAARDGISGTVRARALIQSGVVKEVTVLSGPKVFHNAVRTAMLQYRCQASDTPVSAEQEFVFQLD